MNAYIQHQVDPVVRKNLDFKLDQIKFLAFGLVVTHFVPVCLMH